MNWLPRPSEAGRLVGYGAASEAGRGQDGCSGCYHLPSPLRRRCRSHCSSALALAYAQETRPLQPEPAPKIV